MHVADLPSLLTYSNTDDPNSDGISSRVNEETRRARRPWRCTERYTTQVVGWTTGTAQTEY